MKYQVIDADSHLNSPPDVYQPRVPAKFKDRAPKIVRVEDYDAWVVDGAAPRPISVLQAAAGKTREQLARKNIRFEEMLAGAYDPKARLVDMDKDGIDAQVLYGDGAMTAQDPELRTVLIRAYNDWLVEFCSKAPERLLGQAIVPIHDPDAAIKEVERTAGMKGVPGLFLGLDASNFPLTDPVYERFWAAAAEQKRPVSLHIGGGVLSRRNILHGKNPPPGMLEAYVSMSPMSVAESIATLIFSGVLERHPSLRVIIAEGGIGWLAYFLERMDHVMQKQGAWAGSAIQEKPSFYFRRQILATFEEDQAGMRTYDLIGWRNILWSSDYPHSDTTWPHSRKVIDTHFGKLPEVERRAMVCENAAKAYGLLA
jgi:predicted TIM-barrel fold metal-dependent hydrolase